MSSKNIFEEIPDLDYQEELPQIDVENFHAVVRSRRSVRVFTDETIPEAVMQDCLELALLAPNSSNLQPWEFHWVKNPEKKAALAEICYSQPAAKTAAELVVCIGRTTTWKKHCKQMLEFFDKAQEKVPESARHYYQKLAPFIYNQGIFGIRGYLKKALMNIAGFTRMVPREPHSSADMKLWAAKSTALACENLMLALRAHGFDSCPMEGCDTYRVKKLLDLPRDAVITMIVGAGKRDAKGVYGPRIRFDRDQFIKIV